MTIPSEDGFYWADTGGGGGWFVTEIKAGHVYSSRKHPHRDFAHVADAWTWGPRIPTPDEQPKVESIERVGAASPALASMALLSEHHRRLLFTGATASTITIEVGDAAPCDECGGKGYVDLAFSRSPCSRGCG